MRILKKKQIKEGASIVLEALIKFGLHLKGFFRKSVTLMFILLFMNIANTSPGLSTDTMGAMLVKPSEEELYIDNLKSTMRIKLTEEVETYIQKMAPTSKLTPRHLVDKCLEYNTDIIFVLAQGVLESHFGTKGLALKTNSVWNVGAFDNQRPGRKFWYDTADESLEPYLRLVNEKYLINITSQGDTISKDLHHLVLKGYTNYAGNRFASSRGYENGMRRFMVEIDMETSISFYQDIVKLSNAEILSYFRFESKINEEQFYTQNIN